MFQPHLDILPLPQRRLWEELGQTPSPFVLYGGTALALRLGHRQSLDFDFFSTEPFVPSALYDAVAYLRDSAMIQSSPNTLACRVERSGAVLVSFFGGLSLHRVEEPEPAAGTGLAVASLVDLAATKVKVVLDRASLKDYVDIDALLQAGVTLSRALAAAQIVYGAAFNPLLSLKALAYFGDGDVPQLGPEARRRLLQAVQGVDLAQLSALGHGCKSHVEDRSHDERAR